MTLSLLKILPIHAVDFLIAMRSPTKASFHRRRRRKVAKLLLVAAEPLKPKSARTSKRSESVSA